MRDKFTFPNDPASSCASATKDACQKALVGLRRPISFLGEKFQCGALIGSCFSQHSVFSQAMRTDIDVADLYPELETDC